MTDVVDRATRTRWMAGIRSKDTKPERIVRKYLHRAGLRFRKNVRGLPGRPDIVLPKWGSVILVHGCFWHRHPGCRFSYTPKSRPEFWLRKFHENIERDARNMGDLFEMGWLVHVVWECEITDERLTDLASDIRAGGKP
jgi:DNA mismatch endonuclease, patch repair protein